MLTRLLASVLLLSLFSITACTHRVVVVKHPPHRPVHHKHRLPPGQAKKMYGSKSARSHAPGHQKKRH